MTDFALPVTRLTTVYRISHIVPLSASSRALSRPVSVSHWFHSPPFYWWADGARSVQKRGKDAADEDRGSAHRGIAPATYHRRSRGLAWNCQFSANRCASVQHEICCFDFLFRGYWPDDWMKSWEECPAYVVQHSSVVLAFDRLLCVLELQVAHFEKSRVREAGAPKKDSLFFSNVCVWFSCVQLTIFPVFWSHKNLAAEDRARAPQWQPWECEPSSQCGKRSVLWNTLSFELLCRLWGESEICNR